MSKEKILAGPAIRRLRRQYDLTQAAMAERLDISTSYLNLIERNQRPISARLLVALADRFDLDPRRLVEEQPGGGVAAMQRRLADPLFADLGLDKALLSDWLASAPEAAEAFARLFDQGGGTQPAQVGPTPIALLRAEIERWRNHFADLDHAAEELAEELRLQSGDLYAALADRLRQRHELTIRILPEAVMPDALRRLDLHARQLQLSEMLDPASRTFQLAYQLALLEYRAPIMALVAGAGFDDRTAERLLQRHLTGYFAAAVMMPYGRFLRACEASGYDILVLQRRFGAGFEQVAHRLTTLGRVGARGLPFFMIRVDRAGQVSKRFAGASQAPLVGGDGCCPRWHVFRAFAEPQNIQRQLVELEDGSGWFTIARTVHGAAYGAGGAAPEFVIGLGVAADQAGQLCYARGMALDHGTEVGLGCAACRRPDCTQRAVPPDGVALSFDERQRGMTPFDLERPRGR